ncbi:MAG: hypothetical protein H0X43_12140 [Nitrosospira sp.]|nr:hypothetical protein [Nitrosospira sp.]
MKILRGLVVIFFLAVIYSTVTDAADGEKATYVGSGRYVGEGRSVDDAQLRQRSDEYTERQNDRQRSDERHERAERRERDSGYRDSGGGYSGDY